jgi:hypothetical protein
MRRASFPVSVAEHVVGVVSFGFYLLLRMSQRGEKFETCNLLDGGGLKTMV